MRQPGEVLVVSCYELGHQPVAAASAVAFLERAGYLPSALDLSVEPHDDEQYRRARVVAVSVPMHTALRVGVAAAGRIRTVRPDAHISFCGLYAMLNSDYLLAGVADSVIGGEFEEPLVGLVEALERGGAPRVEGVGVAGLTAAPSLGRQRFPVPSRSALPGIERYAKLEHRGETRLAGAVETTRGCLHLCRHCPIPPVYGGRFFAVPREVVLEDIRRLAAADASHITFSDPDFLNGPTHALRVVRAMNDEHPKLTFDFTAKIEHIVARREIFAELAERGCLFVVSAVESLSDEVLEYLRKGHTRADVFRALRILREASIAMRPSLMPFTPWETLDGYGDILDWIEGEILFHHLDPVQLAIRLLVPPGSHLLELPEMRPHLRSFEPQNFAHVWEHPDPRMDGLQRSVDAIVREDAVAKDRDPERTFRAIRDAWSALRSDARSPLPPPARDHVVPARLSARPPRLTEPWFC